MISMNSRALDLLKPWNHVSKATKSAPSQAMAKNGHDQLEPRDLEAVSGGGKMNMFMVFHGFSTIFMGFCWIVMLLWIVLTRGASSRRLRRLTRSRRTS